MPARVARSGRQPVSRSVGDEPNSHLRCCGATYPLRLAIAKKANAAAQSRKTVPRFVMTMLRRQGNENRCAFKRNSTMSLSCITRPHGASGRASGGDADLRGGPDRLQRLGARQSGRDCHQRWPWPPCLALASAAVKECFACLS